MNNNGYNLDELAQRAADNRLARLALWLDAIEIAAQAEELARDPCAGDYVGSEFKGPKGTVAEHMGYSTRTVSQLATMHDFPEELIVLDAKPGMYWAAMQHSDAPVETIRHAVKEGWTTPAEVKVFLGVKEKRHPPLLVAQVDVAEVEPGQMVIRSDRIKPEDGWPATLRARLSEAKNGRG